MTSPTAVHTFTGRQVDLLTPNAADIAIEDIAHGLAYSTRFNGQTKTPITIAQHCVMGSYLFDDPEVALAYLLHDAHEAYMGDIVRPMRLALILVIRSDHGVRPLDEIERLLNTAITSAFSLPGNAFQQSEIKRIDDIFCAVEGGVGGLFPHIHSAAKLFDYRAPWGMVQAEARFLLRFEELQRQRTADDSPISTPNFGEAVADMNYELSRRPYGNG